MEDILLRGVVRVENVEHPAQYVDAVLKRTQTKHIERTYEIKHADYDDDPLDFLSILARKGGRLLKGGEPDVDGVAKMVLNDFLRGKIPWFTPPPKREGTTETAEITPATDGEVVKGRKGQLGEMPSKVKAESVPALAEAIGEESDEVEAENADLEAFSNESDEESAAGEEEEDDDEAARGDEESGTNGVKLS